MGIQFMSFSFLRVIVTIVCICVIFHISFLYGYMTRIYTIYVHCLKILNLLVWALQTGRKSSLFWPVSQRVQINFIFNDNVPSTYIVFILQYQKVQKNNCQIVWKWLKQASFLSFSMVSYVTVSAYDRCFLSLYMDQVPAML